MKQLNIFDEPASVSKKKNKVSEWKLYIDGASRNNPGPSGTGIYIEKDGIAEIKDGYYVGIKTNNQAEYLALLFGLFMVAEHINKDDVIRIFSDSQLLVRQLNGVYKVKHSHLVPLHSLGKEIMHKLHATITHVLRDENVQADEMANHGIDCKKSPPKNYMVLLKQHGIVL
jgi:ribonuclease HI